MTAGAQAEIEVKFRTTVEGMAAVLASPVFKSPTAVHVLRSVYYDTADHRLFGQHMVLRLRFRDGASPVQSLKSSAGPGRNFCRREIEVPVPGGFPDLTAFTPDVAADIQALIGGRPLEPQFETAVTRRVFLLTGGRSLIEAACDAGDIVAAQGREPLLELELELKTGDDGDLFELAGKLGASLPLMLDFTSKSQRGFALVRGERPRAVKAYAMALQRGATLDDAVRLTLTASLDHFAANWLALRDRGDPEALHQLRVALRRMRSALAIFGDMLPVPRFRLLRMEAKRIARGLGPAREWDVFMATFETVMPAGGEVPDGLDQLRKAAEARRGEAHRAALALLSHRGTTLFVLTVEAILARRYWRDAVKGAPARRLSSPATGPARKGLDRLWRRVLKRGRNFADLGDKERHALRIALKDMRYGSEIFAGVLGTTSRMKRAVTFQAMLGDRNDLVVARRLVKDLTAAAPGAFDRCAGLLLARIAARHHAGERALRDTWKKLKRAKPFWR